MLRHVSRRCCAKLTHAGGDAAAAAAAANLAEKYSTLSSQRLNPFQGPVATTESMSSFRDPRHAPVGETAETLRRRVVYQSQYRGMVELDVILGSFVKKYLYSMTKEEMSQYDTILKQFDNDLFNWLMKGEKPPAAVGELSLWTKLFDHVVQNREELVNFRV